MACMNESFTRSKIHPTITSGFGMAVLLAASLAGCHGYGPSVEREGPDSLGLTSPDLGGGRFPTDFTCDGVNTSPALRWNTPPAGTKSLALILSDRRFGSFVHWVLYDLPPETTSLPTSVPTSGQLPNGARQGQNDFSKIGYRGPCPPRHRDHHYAFTLFALDTKLNLPAGATRAQLDDAMNGHVLARGVFTAEFSH